MAFHHVNPNLRPSGWLREPEILFAAIKEQIALKLKPVNAPAEMLVIDAVQRQGGEPKRDSGDMHSTKCGWSRGLGERMTGNQTEPGQRAGDRMLMNCTV